MRVVVDGFAEIVTLFLAGCGVGEEVILAVVYKALRRPCHRSRLVYDTLPQISLIVRPLVAHLRSIQLVEGLLLEADCIRIRQRTLIVHQINFINLIKRLKSLKTALIAEKSVIFIFFI